MIKKLILIAALTLAGCDKDPTPPTTQMGVASQLSSDSDRVSITKLSEFRDTLAYENWRGVYLIKDKQTGAEFIGVSGIGISELGSHTQTIGKIITSKGDER